jgi:thiol:disulfide interchange protein DsbC
MTRLKILLALLFLSLAAAAFAQTAAGDAAIRQALTRLSPNISIDSIRPSPIAGYKEVAVNGQVIYVSNDGRFLISGTITDLNSRENLTDASEAALRRGQLAALPAAQRISFAPANPRYRVLVFTDIDCSFCRRLHSHIAEYNRLGIAVDYVFFPRAGINSESFNEAVSVWCAPNRQRALTDAKADRPVQQRNCTNPVTLTYNLGRRIGVDGTPAIYAVDGSHIGGYLEPQEMLERLQRVATRMAAETTPPARR